MGTIHLAVAGGLADFRKLMVVKELRRDLTANQSFVTMFLDEAKLAARLNHPNVVQTIEAGQENERLFLSMEFLDGQPYSALLAAAQQDPRFPLPVLLEILCDALAGLHYAHELTEYDGSKLQIVHRDVSPQNIFVTYDGQVKVVDFGIAKATVGDTATTPGVFKGKFGYAAPEQVRGDGVDARTDVFAIGVVLWETLTKKRFSEAAVVNRAAVMMRLYGNEPRISKLDTNVDPHLAAICDRALEIDPAARFANAEELRAALENYLNETDQRVGTATIRELMIKRFAAERAEIHSLIDSYAKTGESAELETPEVELGSEAGNNNPTTLADFSKHLSSHETVISRVGESLRPTPLIPASPPQRSKRRVVWAIGVAALVLALAAGLTLRSAPVRQPPSAASAPPSTERVAAPPSAIASPAAMLPAAAAPVPQPAAAAEVNAAPASTTPEAPARVGSPTPSSEATHARATDRKRTRERQVVVTKPALTVERSTPPVPAPAAAESPREAVAPSPGDVTVGSDLKRVGKSDHRRTIDTDF